MKINSHVEFYHFVRNTGLTNISPDVSSMVRCMEEYSRMCNCDPAAARNAKLNQCRTLYVNFIHKSPEFKDILFSKMSDNIISLCVDGQSVITLSR